MSARVANAVIGPLLGQGKEMPHHRQLAEAIAVLIEHGARVAEDADQVKVTVRVMARVRG